MQLFKGHIPIQSKTHRRSRGIKIQLCPHRGIVLTSRKKLSNKMIDRVLQKHGDWITSNGHIYQATSSLPENLNLLAINQSWIVTPGERKNIKQGQLMFHQDSMIKELKIFIRQTAQNFFPVRLQYWADKTKLEYRQLSIRSQKTRWGSYSSRGTISLNDQLLFMPSTVTDYIIVHELCHRLEANHSAKFWHLVENHLPGYKEQEKLLAHSREFIPHWFRQSLY